MNRKIKFRGKRKDNKKWIHGDLLSFNNEYEICDHNTIDGSRYDVVPATIGQFTGLYDNGGKEVYEGDIVEFKVIGMDTKKVMERIGVVVFRNGEFIVTRNGVAYIIYSVFNGGASVISNIIDNPELIKN